MLILSTLRHRPVEMWWHTRRNQISSFARNGRVYLNRPGGRQFSRLLTAEVCASAVVMLDTPCSEVVWSVLATHSIREFPLHFPTRASPCAITFQLESTTCSLCAERTAPALYTRIVQPDNFPVQSTRAAFVSNKKKQGKTDYVTFAKYRGWSKVIWSRQR